MKLPIKAIKEVRNAALTLLCVSVLYDTYICLYNLYALTNVPAGEITSNIFILHIIGTLIPLGFKAYMLYQINKQGTILLINESEDEDMTAFLKTIRNYLLTMVLLVGFSLIWSWITQIIIRTSTSSF